MIYKQINQVGKRPFVYQCIDLDAYPLYDSRYIIGDAQLVKICHIPGVLLITLHLEVLSDKVSTHKKILRILKVD